MPFTAACVCNLMLPCINDICMFGVLLATSSAHAFYLDHPVTFPAVCGSVCRKLSVCQYCSHISNNSEAAKAMLIFEEDLSLILSGNRTNRVRNTLLNMIFSLVASLINRESNLRECWVPHWLFWLFEFFCSFVCFPKV